MRKYSGTRRETIPLKIMDFFVDFYAKIFYKNRKRAEISVNPRVLIATLGHLGDALTTSYLFPLIKKQYPNAKIDLLTADWCKAVVERNSYLENVFYINHFQTNRRQISKFAKLKDFYFTFRKAVKAMQKHEYDYYIDIRYTDAVAHFVLPFIHAKKAFGFSRRGLGALLGKDFEIPNYDEFHHFEMNLMLLKAIGVEANFEDIHPYYELPKSIDFDKIQAKIALPKDNFLMIFPETGAAKKELSVEFWQKIILDLLQKTSKNIVFCGQTKISSQIIAGISQEFSARMLDSSNKLSIDELAFLTQKADLVITLDSFPAHLACIFTKTVMLYKVTGYPFFPFANFSVLLLHGHEPSKKLVFPRSEVEIHYENPFESEQVKNMILERILKPNIKAF